MFVSPLKLADNHCDNKKEGVLSQQDVTDMARLKEELEKVREVFPGMHHLSLLETCLNYINEGIMSRKEKSELLLDGVSGGLQEGTLNKVENSSNIKSGHQQNSNHSMGNFTERGFLEDIQTRLSRLLENQQFRNMLNQEKHENLEKLLIEIKKLRGSVDVSNIGSEKVSVSSPSKREIQDSEIPLILGDYVPDFGKYEPFNKDQYIQSAEYLPICLSRAVDMLRRYTTNNNIFYKQKLEKNNLVDNWILSNEGIYLKSLIHFSSEHSYPQFATFVHSYLCPIIEAIMLFGFKPPGMKHIWDYIEQIALEEYSNRSQKQNLQIYSIYFTVISSSKQSLSKTVRLRMYLCTLLNSQQLDYFVEEWFKFNQRLSLYDYSCVIFSEQVKKLFTTLKAIPFQIVSNPYQSKIIWNIV